LLKRILLIDPVFLSRLYPELGQFSDCAVRGLIWRLACRENRVFPRTILTYDLVTILYLWSFSSSGGGMPKPALFLLTFACPIILLAGLVHLLIRTRPGMRTTLRRELAARGVEICINCAYDLTLNTSGVCPECGLAIPADLEPFEVLAVDPDANLFDEGSDPADR